MRNGNADIASDLLSPEYLPYFGGHLAERVRVVPTPIPSFNKACRGPGMGKGPAEGWFGIIGGNPGTGKTVVALNLAVAAIEAGNDVAFASMEMLRHDLAPRIYSRLLMNRDVEQVGRGARFNSDRFVSLQDAVGQARDKYKARFLVNKKPIRNKQDLFAFIGAMHEDYGVKYVIVDYIQLACTGGEEGIYGETVETVNWLARFAHEKAVRVDGLSQFKRSTAEDFTRAPRAQGLHGGMIVEASADYILLLDHSRWERDSMRPHIARSWLMLDKNRYGPDRRGNGPRQGIPIEFDFQVMSLREPEYSTTEGVWPTGGRKDK